MSNHSQIEVLLPNSPRKEEKENPKDSRVFLSARVAQAHPAFPALAKVRTVAVVSGKEEGDG